MRKSRWLAVFLGLTCILVVVSAEQEIELQLSGHLTSESGSCQQLSESTLVCQLNAGSTGVLGLSASVTPPEHVVVIEGWSLPSWVDFEPASGHGAVAATAVIQPPTGSTGQTALLVFTAITAEDVVAELHVQLEIVSSKPTEDVPGGEGTEEGTEFETPFLPDISTFVLGDVLDCETGVLIDPIVLRTEFEFAAGAQAPYSLDQLEQVLIHAPGYHPYAITAFHPYTISLLFVQVTILTPEETSICLEPIRERSLDSFSPAGECVGEVSSVVRDPSVPFQWAALGDFTHYEILIYDNPCGLYPPPDSPTPTPTPTPSPTPTPAPVPTPTDQPVRTTAGVWEPLWEKLTPAQREELASRGLSGWGWVKAAREQLGETGDEIPAEGLIQETEGVLLPDTELIARIGPISGETTQALLPLEALLEPGQAFIWQVLGVYEDPDGERGALLTSAQCVRYQPMDTVSGDVVPVVSCPECASEGEVWDCDQPIQVVRPLDIYPKKTDMNPDERIAISILAEDSDLLLWQCECLEETQRKVGSYPERLSYSWQLTGSGELVDVFENSAIYQLPEDLAPGETTTDSIRVTLLAPRGGDKSIEGQIVLTITAGEEGCDNYTVQANVIQPAQEQCPPPLQEYGRDCVAVLKYGKANGPIAGSIMLYSMAFVNEPVLLKATHVDTDELTIKCERTICIEHPEVDYPLPDPLAFVWDDQGAGGQFPLGNTGRCVVYIPPQKDGVTIHCKPTDLIVRDRDVDEMSNQPIARIVIDLTTCDRDWLPEHGNSTSFTARTYQYRNGQCTYPGPARRITFDLSNVSSETGYCVNRGDSLEWDLFFSAAVLGNSYYLCEDETFLAREATYFSRATTKERASEATVVVSSEDFGSYGEISARAFNAQTIEPRAPDGVVSCTLGENLVDIPLDDVPEGGNHIADKWDAKFPVRQGEFADADESSNNVHDGDGLIRYDEYRGVDVDDDGRIAYDDARTKAQELANPMNERLSPDLKDLFVTTFRAQDLGDLRFGEAFENAEIVVHRFRGADQDHIDVMVIDPTAGTPPNASYTTAGQTDMDGHLNKLNTPGNFREWMVDWLGGSTIGTAAVYGAPLVFDECIEAYFNEKPYVDGSTLANPADPPATFQWTGAPNGILDGMTMIEDRNDNGNLDAHERDGVATGAQVPDDGDGVLDGDHLSIALAATTAFYSVAWNADLSVYDADNDGQVQVGTNEYTMAQVTLHVLTHEMGHGVGIGPHCNDATCLMYSETPNWDRQDHLCPRCQGLLRIHNR